MKNLLIELNHGGKSAPYRGGSLCVRAKTVGPASKSIALLAHGVDSADHPSGRPDGCRHGARAAIPRERPVGEGLVWPLGVGLLAVAGIGQEQGEVPLVVVAQVLLIIPVRLGQAGDKRLWNVRGIR